MSEKVKEMTGVGSARRRKAIKSAAQKSEGIVCMTASAAAAFICAMGSLLGFPSYMSAAVAAISGRYSLFAFVGALAAYLIKGSLDGSIIQLCSILVIAAIEAINPFGESKKNDPMYLSILTTGALMLFSCVMSAAVPADFYTACMRMINSLLCGCVVFIARTIAVNRGESGVYDLTGINGVFVSVIYIIAVSSFASLEIFSLNLGRILGTFVLLQAVRKYRCFGGALIGALTTCGVLMCEPSLARNTLLLATSGLICGAFTQFGILAVVLIFLGSSLVSLVAVGVNADTYRMFADLAAGSLLFIIVPLSAVKKIDKRIYGFRNSLDIVGQTTSSRLVLAGEALGEIRRRLDLVTAAMDKKASSRRCAEDVKNGICADCANYELCFEINDIGDSGFKRLEMTVHDRGMITSDEVEALLACCTRSELIARAFTDFHARLLEEKAENIRMREMRELLTEQLCSMENILGDLSFRSSQVRSIDAGMSARLKEYFSSIGCKGAKACVYVDENLCMRADVFMTSQFSADTVKITAAVSSLLDCDMGFPDTVREDDLTRISFAEIPAYTAQTASFSASAGGEYSGDSFETFDLNGSEKYVLLSDGMGTGKRARLDSVFTVSLTQKLIMSGISMTTAHGLINSMMRVKGWEESFATMDLLRIDLSGGAATILKSGAVQSRLCRDGCVTRLGGQAFPVGILSACQPDITDIKLFDGDIIVMTSDGADEQTADEVARIAANESRTPLKQVMQLMGKAAMEKRTGKNNDDLTVIAVKICLNSCE